jgi:lipocalin-like protein
MLKYTILGFISVILAGCASVKPENTALTDEYIREQIIGSWIVPEQSSDYIPLLAKTREEFRNDGTYIYYVYSDKACTQVESTETVSYTIENRILISNYEDGTDERDSVVGVDAQYLTLRSFSSGMTYIRERAESCAR